MLTHMDAGLSGCVLCDKHTQVSVGISRFSYQLITHGFLKLAHAKGVKKHLEEKIHLPQVSHNL